MKKLTNLIIVISVILLSSCSGASWQITRNTPHGRYTYFDHGWGGGCPTYSSQPLKKTNYNRQAYDWQRRR